MVCDGHLNWSFATGADKLPDLRGLCFGTDSLVGEGSNRALISFASGAAGGAWSGADASDPGGGMRDVMVPTPGGAVQASGSVFRTSSGHVTAAVVTCSQEVRNPG